MNDLERTVLQKVGFLPKKRSDKYIVEKCNINGWRRFGIRNDMVFKSCMGEEIKNWPKAMLLKILRETPNEDLKSSEFEPTLLAVYNHVGLTVEQRSSRYEVTSIASTATAIVKRNASSQKYLHSIATLKMENYEKREVWNMLLSLDIDQFAFMNFRFIDDAKEVMEKFGFVLWKQREGGECLVRNSTVAAQQRWSIEDDMVLFTVHEERMVGMHLAEVYRNLIELVDIEGHALQFRAKPTKRNVLQNVGFLPERSGGQLAYTVVQCSQRAATHFNIQNGVELYAIGDTSAAALTEDELYTEILGLNRRDYYKLQFRQHVNDIKNTVLQVMGFIPQWNINVGEFLVSGCKTTTTEQLHVCDGMAMVELDGKVFKTLTETCLYDMCCQFTETDLVRITFDKGVWLVNPARVYERIGFLPIKPTSSNQFVVSACSEEMASEMLIWDGMEFTHIGNCAIGRWGVDKLFEKLLQLDQNDVSSFVFRAPISAAAVLDKIGFVPVKAVANEYYIVSTVTQEARTFHNISEGDELRSIGGETVWAWREEDVYQALLNYDHNSMEPIIFGHAPRDGYITEESIAHKYGFILRKERYGECQYVIDQCTPEAAEKYGITNGNLLYRIFHAYARTFHKNGLYERMLSNENCNMVFCTKEQFTLLKKYVVVEQEWDYDHPCPHCGFIYLISDHPRRRKNKCCMDGGAFTLPNFPTLQPMPQMLNAIATTKINHMTNSCTYYNNVFSLGATGVDNGKEGVGWETGVGDRCAKICGRTYHYLPRTGGSGGIQYFTFDANNEELFSHENTISNLNTRRIVNLQKTYLKLLYDELVLCNPLMQECEMVGSMVGHGEIMDHEDVIKLKSSINVHTCMFDVAAITSNAITGSRILTFKLKGEAQACDIPAMSPLLEPLTYPLFFPHGEFGWSESIKKEIKFYAYMQTRMICPERDENGNMLVMLNKQGSRLLPVNRFQLMARLGQHYAVDMISRIIDHGLLYQKENQDRMTRGHITDRDGSADDAEGATYLHQSHHGSRRHLREKARDALCLVSEYGKPTWFITLTCNPMWPEIQEQLLPGQTAFDRPDIVTRVFKQRLQAFMANLRAGKYFDDFKIAADGSRIPHLRRQVVYEMYVIEYQQRGMPHAHIVVKLENVPDFKSDEAGTAKWIDERLNAVYPEETDKEYYDLVSAHLIHNCSSSCSKDGICKYGFHANCIQMATTFDEKGFPHYRRTKESDLRVVPHTRETVMDWRGHVFIEFAGSSRCTLYLYKYLYKGSKKVRMELTNIEGVNEKDEITMHLRGRYLCSMDAMWRILGYQTYPASSPPVLSIAVIMPQDVEYNRHKNEVTDMLVYFNRPDCLAELKYSELFQKYTRRFVRPNSMNDEDEGIRYYELCINGIDRVVYLVKRAENTGVLIRLAMRYPMQGEVFYLRVILSKRPCTSFVDALTCGEKICATYQESAIAHGYVNDVKEASICFDEACQFKLPRELRSLFALMTVQGFPTHHLFFNEYRFRSLTEDYIGNRNIIQSVAGFRQQFLRELHELLSENGGLDLGDYGFPVPKNLSTELERERMRYSADAEREKLERLNSGAPNNVDQQHVFDSVAHCIDSINESAPGKLLFLSGQGGCGKSTLAKKLMAYARGQGLIALGCASTGLAATVYEDFYTAHSLFCYPVQDEDEKDESEPARCELERNPQRGELIKESSFIVWDESLCNHKELFEAAHRATNEFQGKVVLLMGDFRQIMPVIKDGTRVELLQACLNSSYLWSSFRVFALTINMRLELLKMRLATQRTILEADNNASNYERINELTDRLHKQTRYGEMILSVGEGISTHPDVSIVNDHTEAGSQHLAMHTVAPYVADTEAALMWLYPGGFEHQRLIDTAILGATNELVEEWNEKVQNMNPNVAHELLSHDSLSEVDDPYGNLAGIISDEVLADTKVNGVPPHVLRLKVGDVCLVMRNLSKRYGLATNSRVIVQFISRYCIRVQTIGDRPVSVTIPRIRFRFKVPGGHSFEVLRTQFPLRLAYSLTMNKSQGQSLKAVLLDTRRAPFAHGHFYVALSRVLDYATIRIYCNEEDVYDEYPVVVNVVYPELIQCI